MVEGVGFWIGGEARANASPPLPVNTERNNDFETLFSDFSVE